jgi:hypothetical protein
MASNPPTPSNPTLGQKLYDVIYVIVPEIFATFLLLSFVGASEKFLHWWVGDKKFFDVLPVRWVFDAAELAIILYFVVRIARQIGRD